MALVDLELVAYSVHHAVQIMGSTSHFTLPEACKAMKRAFNINFFTKLHLLALGLAGLILFADLMIPLGVAGGVPYVAVVLVAWWLPGRRDMFALAFLGSLLTVLGFFLSPEAGGILWMVLFNRLLALFAIWVTATLMYLARKSSEGELKRAEKQVLESEEKFRNLVEGSIQGIFVHGNFELLFANQAFADLLNFESVQELMERDLLKDLTPSDNRQEAQERYRLRVAGEPVPRFLEYLFVRKDGSEVLMELMITVIHWEGAPAVLATTTDISARREAEDKLRENEHLLQTIFDTIPHRVYVKDRDTRYLKVNRAFAQTLGIEPEQIVGVKTEEFEAYPEKLAHRYAENDRKTMTTGERQEFQAIPVYTAGGERELYDVIKVPLRGEDGEIVGIVGVDSEVTARIRAEERLRRSQQLLQTIFDAIPQWLLVKDATGRYLTVNRAASEHLGLPVEEIIGRRPSELGTLSSATSQILTEQDQQVLHSGETMEFPETTVSVVGKPPSELNIVKIPLRNDEGEILGVVGVGEDVTDRLETEERLKEQEKQLIHADKMASLGTLVSGVAHEINNPNASIMLNAPLISNIWQGTAALLKRQGIQNGETMVGPMSLEAAMEEVPAMLEDITKCSRRVKNIVEKLKEFARQPEDRAFVSVDVNEVVESAVRLLKGQIEQMTRNLGLHLVPDLPPIQGNFQEIEQVVINLIVNALQALRDPEKSVTIITSYDERDSRAIVTVQDEGKGIPEAELQKIMDPFYTTKRDKGGTGLGLSISFGIVKNHGGSLHFFSKVGEGTAATFTLPVSGGSTRS